MGNSSKALEKIINCLMFFYRVNGKKTKQRVMSLKRQWEAMLTCGIVTGEEKSMISILNLLALRIQF